MPQQLSLILSVPGGRVKALEALAFLLGPAQDIGAAESMHRVRPICFILMRRLARTTSAPIQHDAASAHVKDGAQTVFRRMPTPFHNSAAKTPAYVEGLRQ